jgi:hypothetical protein
MASPKDATRNDVSFGKGADRRLARAVLDAGRGVTRTTAGSARARMLEGLRTAAAGVAAALAETRRAAPGAPGRRRPSATTALLVACGGLEQAIRAVVPDERRTAQRLKPASRHADDSAA